MPTQPTCKRCGVTFDPSFDLHGRLKQKRSGRPRRFCTLECQGIWHNANKSNGGEGSWPRSKAIEQEVCDRYLAGESTIVLADSYAVACETIIRLLKRNDVTRRSKNGRRRVLAAAGSSTRRATSESWSTRKIRSTSH